MNTEFLFFVPVPLLAFVVDMVLGDPHSWPHPVKFIGIIINRFEALCRNLENRIPLVISGAVSILLITVFVAGATKAITSLPLGILFTLYLAYAGLALKSLVQEARNVLALLNQKTIEEARTGLSMLVSRDTSTMNAEAIRRSLAETISENFNDGFVAPFLYLSLFGVPGLWAYKTINTFDSMWGYKTARFSKLGMFAAKIDDILNWIPARLSWLLLCLVGWPMGLASVTALSKTPAQARTMESPNAGWPMACSAWLLKAPMGGAVTYFGSTKQKPHLGPQNGTWTNQKLKTLLRLIIRTGWFTAAVSTTIYLCC